MHVVSHPVGGVAHGGKPDPHLAHVALHCPCHQGSDIEHMFHAIFAFVHSSISLMSLQELSQPPFTSDVVVEATMDVTAIVVEGVDDRVVEGAGVGENVVVGERIGVGVGEGAGVGVGEGAGVGEVVVVGRGVVQGHKPDSHLVHVAWHCLCHQGSEIEHMFHSISACWHSDDGFVLVHIGSHPAGGGVVQGGRPDSQIAHVAWHWLCHQVSDIEHIFHTISAFLHFSKSMS